MSATDPRFHELFRHVRAAVDILEQMLLDHAPSREKVNERPAKNDHQFEGAKNDQSQPARLSYTLKEVQELVGISRSAIYLALADGDLRAVKAGRRTLVLAKDLQAWLETLPPKSKP
jgi:excisionase family DNA binding protein